MSNTELEKAHPAEFLTRMHLKNEEEHRLTSSDAERFLVLYKLHRLHRDGIITDNVFESNHTALLRAVVNSASRHGLSNLLRSPVLADAVKRVLDHPSLHPTFNASTWGKKLVKGRFFQLIADLLDEMLVQHKLLLGADTNVDPQPFQLPSQCCTWKYLEKSTIKKDHAWKNLPGGAIAAFERVKQRPVEFVTFTNPDGTGEWTLPQMVLLPSVLTSEALFSELNKMYHLAQHLIRITAGDSILEKYTSKIPHTSDDDHPVGIISVLIKDRLKGKPSNIPHMIIHKLWTSRETYLTELTSYQVEEASSTSVSCYNSLLRDSKQWRKLVNLLKLSKLPEGIFVSRVPIPDAGSRAETLLVAIRKRQAKQVPSSASEPILDILASEAATQAQLLAPSVPIHQSRSPSLSIEETPSGNSLISSGNHQRKRPSDTPPAPKRQRVRIEESDPTDGTNSAHHSSEDEDYEQDSVEPEDKQQHPEMASDRVLRCHHLVQQQLEELHGQVLQMESHDARALSNLLSIIQGISQAPYFRRVVHSLVDDGQVIDSIRGLTQ
ncbi:hypothetical protein RSOLAG1IB_11608 [Rhizoctonia solani AG-1 IB]|uniref:Uncharacterized protein n=1 Tax=Thanatephorus cucumeris (strain AG1-IB / isolate 7/3/14) TaxID=1108050 RepID=A0A0B7F9K0_THACB|nr:hypothetical protein RSOLAG1IB_11608 [Rhizoctonia solani AG-1 IB]